MSYFLIILPDQEKINHIIKSQ